MRTLARLAVITCALLFGIPAGALLLAHMGFIPLPADAYVSTVDATTTPAVTYNTAEPNPAKLERTARAAAGRAAIVAANRLLPHYQRGVNRPWNFQENSGHGVQDVTATVHVCASCPSGRDILFVSAKVGHMTNDGADVTLRWSLHNGSRTYNRRGELLSPGTIQQTGEITIRLENHDGRWHTIEE